MESNVYWEVFCATGEPMAYMLYRNTAAADEAAKD